MASPRAGPASDVYQQAFVVAAGIALAAGGAAAAWALWQLLAQFQEPLLWAFLVSVALRDTKTAIVSFLRDQLSARSLPSLLCRTLLFPLLVLKDTAHELNALLAAAVAEERALQASVSATFTRIYSAGWASTGASLSHPAGTEPAPPQLRTLPRSETLKRRLAAAEEQGGVRGRLAGALAYGHHVFAVLLRALKALIGRRKHMRGPAASRARSTAGGARPSASGRPVIRRTPTLRGAAGAPVPPPATAPAPGALASPDPATAQVSTPVRGHAGALVTHPSCGSAAGQAVADKPPAPALTVHVSAAWLGGDAGTAAAAAHEDSGAASPASALLGRAAGSVTGPSRACVSFAVADEDPEDPRDDGDVPAPHGVHFITPQDTPAPGDGTAGGRDAGAGDEPKGAEGNGQRVPAAPLLSGVDNAAAAGTRAAAAGAQNGGDGEQDGAPYGHAGRAHHLDARDRVYGSFGGSKPASEACDPYSGMYGSYAGTEQQGSDRGDAAEGTSPSARLFVWLFRVAVVQQLWLIGRALPWASLILWLLFGVAGVAALVVFDTRLDTWVSAGRTSLRRMAATLLDPAHARAVNDFPAASTGGDARQTRAREVPAGAVRDEEGTATPPAVTPASRDATTPSRDVPRDRTRAARRQSLAGEVSAQCVRGAQRSVSALLACGMWVLRGGLSAGVTADRWARRRLLKQLNEIVSVGLVVGTVVGVLVLSVVLVVRIGSEGHDAVLHLDRLVRNRAAAAAAAAKHLHRSHLPGLLGLVQDQQRVLAVGLEGLQLRALGLAQSVLPTLVDKGATLATGAIQRYNLTPWVDDIERVAYRLPLSFNCTPAQLQEYSTGVAASQVTLSSALADAAQSASALAANEATLRTVLDAWKHAWLADQHVGGLPGADEGSDTAGSHQKAHADTDLGDLHARLIQASQAVEVAVAANDTARDALEAAQEAAHLAERKLRACHGLNKLSEADPASRLLVRVMQVVNLALHSDVARVQQELSAIAAEAAKLLGPLRARFLPASLSLPFTATADSLATSYDGQHGLVWASTGPAAAAGAVGRQVLSAVLGVLPANVRQHVRVVAAAVQRRVVGWARVAGLLTTLDLGHSTHHAAAPTQPAHLADGDPLSPLEGHLTKDTSLTTLKGADTAPGCVLTAVAGVGGAQPRGFHYAQAGEDGGAGCGTGTVMHGRGAAADESDDVAGAPAAQGDKAGHSLRAGNDAPPREHIRDGSGAAVGAPRTSPELLGERSALDHAQTESPIASATPPPPPPLLGAAGSLLQLGQQLGLAEGAVEVLGQLGGLAGSLLSGVSGGLAQLLGSSTSFALDTGAALYKAASSVVTFAVDFALFLGTLLYLLSADEQPLDRALHLLPLTRQHRQQASDALSGAMRAVFVSSLRLALFHACFTWITLRAVGTHLITLLTLASSLLAVLPVLPPWAPVAVSAAELALSGGQYTAAVLLLAVHVLVSGYVDDLIVSEQPSNQYLVGFGIAGGMAVWSNPLKGVLLGPMCLALLSAAYTLHSTFVGDQHAAGAGDAHDEQDDPQDS